MTLLRGSSAHFSGLPRRTSPRFGVPGEVGSLARQVRQEAGSNRAGQAVSQSGHRRSAGTAPDPPQSASSTACHLLAAAAGFPNVQRVEAISKRKETLVAVHQQCCRASHGQPNAAFGSAFPASPQSPARSLEARLSNAQAPSPPAARVTSSSRFLNSTASRGVA